MSGGSIRTMLNTFGPFGMGLIQSYTAQILQGLSFLHSQGIIHRDIKGSNILVNTSGCVKLADFGASKRLSHVSTGASSLHGTAHWMAPEVIRQKEYNSKADVWSLGITLIEMATGKPPFYNKDAISVMFLITSLKKIEIPERFNIIGKEFTKSCLNMEPNKRPTANELLIHEFITKPQNEINNWNDDIIRQNSKSELKIFNILNASESDRRPLECIADVKNIVSNRSVDLYNSARNALWLKKLNVDDNKKLRSPSM